MKKHYLLGIVATLCLVGAGCSKLNDPAPVSNMPSTTVSTPAVTTSTDSKPVTQRYIGGSPEVCARIKFSCNANEQYFSNSGGCGCELLPTGEPTPTTPPPVAGDTEQTVCYDLYKPVCAEKTVYCIKAPCPPIKQTYSNDCFAKKDGAKNIVDGACAEK